MTSPEQLEADAVLRGLASGRVGCMLCDTFCENWAFTELGPDGRRRSCCSGCVAKFRNAHGLMTTAKATAALIHAVREGLAGTDDLIDSYFRAPQVFWSKAEIDSIARRI